MDEAALSALLEQVATGGVSARAALQRIKRLDTEDLGFARLDHHRLLRRGFPEVIYTPGKTPEQVAIIAQQMAAAGQTVLATRCSAETYEVLCERVPDAVYHAVARCAVAVRSQPPPAEGVVAVVTAGTSDIPVAEEAALTVEVSGSAVDRLWDVGVAGIHRVLANRDRLLRANVVVVVAGMEGALPSVIGGLVDRPVIAVPTSVGYGASFAGLAALLGMLNSCAPGLTVVNIDNGFGAGYAAGMINRMASHGAAGASTAGGATTTAPPGAIALEKA